jgi:hypothetical protein
MKPNLTTKPVIVVKSGVETYHKTRNDASMFLFGKIDKKALDNLMRNSTNELGARYLYGDDRDEFNERFA